MTSTIDSLERIAQRIRTTSTERDRRVTPLSLLEREIAFWSEHLDDLRRLQEDQLRRILRAECYVGTDLLALESYAPKVFLYRFQARDNLKNKLLHLDTERRRLMQAHQRDVAHVHEKLLHLVNQRAQLRT